MPLIRKPSAPPHETAAEPAAVLAALTSGSDDERWAAARAAASLPGGASALAAALSREDDPRVREAMFTSLARIGTPESAALMIPFVRSDHAHLRTAALDALCTMTTAAGILPALLGDPDADVRLLACELARGLPEESANRLLCGLIDAEPDANVCAAAVEVLAEIGRADALPALMRCEERFRAVPFLAFALKIAAERIRAQTP